MAGVVGVTLAVADPGPENLATSADKSLGIPAFLLKGTHASNTLTALGGTVGIAYFGGEVATVATLKKGNAVVLEDRPPAGASEVGWNSTERQFCACGQDPCGWQEQTPARLNTLARRGMDNVELRDSQETDQC